jgi:hypothetical protein
MLSAASLRLQPCAVRRTIHLSAQRRWVLMQGATHAEPEKGDAQKSGILGSISGAYGRYKERAAERKVQGAAVLRAPACGWHRAHRVDCARGRRGVDEAEAGARGIAAKIAKHCGADVTPPDTIIDCLHRLNHLWLAGYKYEHEKIGKQVRASAGIRCGAAVSAHAILTGFIWVRSTYP